MAITALSTPPSRLDPANFPTRADAFLGALPAFVTEANALELNVNTRESSAVLSAASAALSATAAAASAVTAQSVAPSWVSGTTYAAGAVAWSPITFLTYRRKIAGSGTVDPFWDALNWESITDVMSPFEIKMTFAKEPYGSAWDESGDADVTLMMYRPSWGSAWNELTDVDTTNKY